MSNDAPEKEFGQLFIASVGFDYDSPESVKDRRHHTVEIEAGRRRESDQGKGPRFVTVTAQSLTGLPATVSLPNGDTGVVAGSSFNLTAEQAKFLGERLIEAAAYLKTLKN